MRLSNNKIFTFQPDLGEGNFATIPNDAISSALSSDAFRVLVHMVNCGKHWRPSAKAGPSNTNLSQYAYDQAVKELKEAGYLRVCHRSGTKNEYDYYVASDPVLLPEWQPDHGTIKGGTTTFDQHGSSDEGRSTKVVQQGSALDPLTNTYDQDGGTKTGRLIPQTHPVTNTVNSSNICKDTGNRVTVKEPSDDSQDDDYWLKRSPDYRNQKLKELDELRIQLLDGDPHSYQKRLHQEILVATWQKKSSMTDNVDDGERYIRSVILGASHDPRGKKIRKHYADWPTLLEQDADLCLLWYALYEADSENCTPQEFREQREILVWRGFTLTPDQVAVLKNRHPRHYEAWQKVADRPLV